MQPIADFIQGYQFLYDNKLQPNRKVDVSKTGDKNAISQQGLIELEKALAMGGIEPRSFKRWNKNFVIGRALSLGDGVYDTRGKDFNLQRLTGKGRDKSSPLVKSARSGDLGLLGAGGLFGGTPQSGHPLII